MQMVSEKDGEDAYREIEGSFDKEHAGHKDRPKLRRVHLSLQYFRYQFGLRARREKLSPVEYRHYLDWAYNILYEVDDSIRSLIDEDAGAVAHTVWRHQRIDLFHAGDDKRGFSISRAELIEVSAKYLAQSALRSDYLDWVFIDILLFAEIDAFAHSLMSGPPLGPVNWAFIFAEGNQLKYFILQWVFSLIGFVARYVVLPAGAIWAYADGVTTSAAWLAGVFAVYLGLKIVSIPALLRQRKARKKAHQTLNAMVAAYGLIEPPVINPGRLKSAIDEAISQGAVLPTAALSIIDRLVRIDSTSCLPFGTGS